MQKLKFFIGIIAMIMFAFGFSACEKESDIQNKKVPEYYPTNSNTSTETNGINENNEENDKTRSWYIYPTWPAEGLGDEKSFSVNGATTVIITATRDVGSVADPMIHYSWNNFGDYGELIISPYPGVTTSEIFTGNQIESNTLYLRQVHSSETLGPLKSLVTVSYQYGFKYHGENNSLHDTKRAQNLQVTHI